RGTRVREDYGKLVFNILDYTGSATRLFADPDFDGDPAELTIDEIDENGDPIHRTSPKEPPGVSDPAGGFDGGGPGPIIIDPPAPERRKFYVDGGRVEIAGHLVYDLDPDGKQLRVIQYSDYTGERVRSLYRSLEEIRD